MLQSRRIHEEQGLDERSTEEVANRRARRSERRKRQRAANIGRAAKMHQARISHQNSVGPASAIDRLIGGTYVGCSGWYYWHWKGRFYPPDIPSSQWFSTYQHHFQTVELNAPFYSWPTIGTVKTWTRQAAPGFVYTIKVCELITHTKRFEETKALIEDFGYIADLLNSQMGCFLFQLPPSVRYGSEMLQRILSQLDSRHRNVVEFRHKSWWNEDVFSAFKSAGAIFCSCSGPRLPDELVKTADDIYIRFHGVNQWYRHHYSDAELLVWVKRIRTSGAKTVWVYFNNDRDGNAITNAKRLSQLLDEG